MGRQSLRDEVTPTMLEVPERTKADGPSKAPTASIAADGVAPADRDRDSLGKPEGGGSLGR